ncbi:MAG: succinylglutamate desuccinylase/aspartoacylase family protein, partial [Simkaniaceae bacterium]|nr:succinylglutamate desuccinylase/aspartoacylase family protein [Simkaniaceae bacterium]
MDFEKNSRLSICDTVIQPGERVTLALPTPEIYTCAPSYIPIHVIHGKRKGPCLLVCAALHGDEINGVAIIQKLLEIDLLNKISGTLIAIPVMNIFGLITQSRHLLDRRDLAGSFPGSETGSFASRLAYLLTTEVLSKVTHCIDIHTG